MTADRAACRFALNLANAALVGIDGNGELRGRAVEIARDVAKFLGRHPILLRYETAAAVLADVHDGWDVAFLAVDPARAEAVAYTRPYLNFDVGCAVRADADFTDVASIDQPGLTIACARGGYATAVRQRIVQASILDVPTPAEAFRVLEAGEVDGAVGLVPALDAAARQVPLRRLAGCLARVEHALAVPAAQRELLTPIEAALRRL